jgi:hypothetical protein
VRSPVAALLPSSPRKRRRLLRLSLALVALAAAAGAYLLLPDPPHPPPEHFSNEAAQLYDPSTVTTTLSRADRLGIDRTLASFVRDAMGRHDLVSTYRLSAPALRAGETLAQWKAGRIPVYPYDARPGSSKGWDLQFREGNHAAVEVFLYPSRRETTGPITVAIDLRKLRGRWLVEGLAPTAVFSKPGQRARVVANTDLFRGDASNGEARLDAKWLAAPIAAILALMLTTVVVVYLRRDKRT